MINYVPGLAHDKSGVELQNFAIPKKALTVTSDENGSTSSVITLTQDTTAVEVAAIGAPVVIRWVATTDTEGSVVSAVTGANFDNVVGTGTVRQFAVPIERQGLGQGSVVGANRLNGLYQRLATKTIGVASVMIVELGN